MSDIRNFVVNSIEDTVNGSDNFTTLREAIISSNSISGQNTISFNLSAGSEIQLVEPLNITDNLIINGLGADRLAISGNNTFSNFFIKNTTVVFNKLTITNGFNGINLGSNSNLTVTNSALIDNANDGIGVNGDGNTLSISNTSISNNFGDGIDVNTDKNIIRLSNVNLIDNIQDGFEIDGNKNTVTASNSNFSNNIGNGFNIDKGGNNNVTLNKSSIAGNIGNGIDVVSMGNTITLSQVSVTANIGDGMEIDGNKNTIIASNSSFTNNVGDGIDYNGSNNTVKLSGVCISGNSEDDLPVVSVTAAPTFVTEGGQLKWNFNLSNAATTPLVVKLDLTQDTDPLPGDIQYFVDGSKNITNFELVRNADGTINNALVTIAAGAKEATLLSNVIADGVVEGPESITYSLVSGNGYSVDPTVKNASFTIIDGLPVVSVTAAPTFVTEGGQLKWNFNLSNAATTPLVVKLDLTQDTDPLPGDIQYFVDGSKNITNFELVRNADGTINNALVTIAAGAKEATLLSNVIADGVVEGPESITYSLVSGNGYSVDPTVKNASFTIIDGLPVVSVTAAPTFVTEASGTPEVLTISLIFGNAGKDVLLGNAGDDIIFGGSQSGIISRGTGNDTIYRNGGGNLIDGGVGNNTIFSGAGEATVALNIGEGFNTINNFQLGSSSFYLGSLLNNYDLSFANSSSGVRISAGNDLLGVVSNQLASTFGSNSSSIFKG